MKMRYLAIGGLGLWMALGNPANDVAGWLWGNHPAPWEKIDAFYYPDRNNLSVHRASHDVGSVAGCRSWVVAAAQANSDVYLTRGDYECGVGKLRSMGDLTVYRITVR